MTVQRPSREPQARNRRKAAAQVSSVAGALALTFAFPALGTPLLAGLAVAAIWVESQSK